MLAIAGKPEGQKDGRTSLDSHRFLPGPKLFQHITYGIISLEYPPSFFNDGYKKIIKYKYKIQFEKFYKNIKVIKKSNV